MACSCRKIDTLLLCFEHIGFRFWNLNSTNKCKSQELIRRVSCSTRQPYKLVNRKGGAHVSWILLALANYAGVDYGLTTIWLQWFKKVVENISYLVISPCLTIWAILDSNQWHLACRARKNSVRVFWFSYKCFVLLGFKAKAGRLIYSLYFLHFN